MVYYVSISSLCLNQSSISFPFCRTSTLKTKSSEYLQLFNQSKSFVSTYSQSFEDTRLSHCDNKVILVGFKILPAWSSILFHNKVSRRPCGTKKHPDRGYHWCQVVIEVGCVAVGCADVAMAPYQTCGVCCVGGQSLRSFVVVWKKSLQVCRHDKTH